jgi:GcrA cell cycle regulator
MWSAAHIRYLRQRWSNGASAARIARKLGGGLSRNAVLGKIRRLAMAAGNRRRRRRPDRKAIGNAPSFVPPAHVLPAQAIAARVRPFPAWVVDAQPYAENPAADADIPVAQRRSLLDLNSQTCRWPVGDPGSDDEFFFCGAPPLTGKPYCAGHCARAYRAQEARPRQAVPRHRNGATLAKVGAQTSRAGEANEPRQQAESAGKIAEARAEVR